MPFGPKDFVGQYKFDRRSMGCIPFEWRPRQLFNISLNHLSTAGELRTSSRHDVGIANSQGLFLVLSTIQLPGNDPVFSNPYLEGIASRG